MDKMNAVFGIYQSRSLAEIGVERLKDAGFANSDVSILFSSDNGDKLVHQNSTKAPEGATTGMISGGTIGGVLGWLAGIGSLAIPGVGPFIAAGPIMGLLAGTSIGGALGGLTGALIGLGIPEYEAKLYENALNNGGILVCVHASNSDRATYAEEILDNTGANDISAKDIDESDHKHSVNE